MLKRIQKFVLCISLLTTIPAFSGCIPLLIGAAAGAGGYAWIRGVLVKQYELPVSKVHDAVLGAMKKLSLSVHYDKADRITAVTRAEFSDGKNVNIDINAVTEHSAQIKIRVGVFGDRMRSELILDAVDKSM